MCFACWVVLGVLVVVGGLLLWFIWPTDDSREDHWESDNAWKSDNP